MFCLAFNFRSIVFIILVGVAALLILITSTLQISTAIKFIIAIIILMIDILAFSTRYYLYLLGPLFRMKGGAIVLDNDDPFTMASSGTSIITRSEGEVYASTFVKIPIYRSSTEMNDQEKLDFSRLFGRVLTLSKTPIKIATQMYMVNKDEYINKIKIKLNEAEGRYNDALAKRVENPTALDRAKGEVTMWRNLSDSISETKSQTLVSFGMVTAVGGNEEEAVSLSNQQAEELASGISSILGVTAYLIKGEELALFVEPDARIPLSTISERMKTRTEGL